MKVYLSRTYEKTEVAGQLTNLQSKNKNRHLQGDVGTPWAFLGQNTEYRATTQVDKKTFYSNGKKELGHTSHKKLSMRQKTRE